jgi:hypothetical protein
MQRTNLTAVRDLFAPNSTTISSNHWCHSSLLVGWGDCATNPVHHQQHTDVNVAEKSFHLKAPEAAWELTVYRGLWHIFSATRSYSNLTYYTPDTPLLEQGIERYIFSATHSFESVNFYNNV